MHTCNPVFAAPTVKEQPLLWVKWRLARLTKAKYPALSFGYIPSELDVPAAKGQSKTEGRALGPAMHQLFSLRPQTLAFSLCDSPIGLLAVLLDLIATQSPGSLLNPRPRSPFLDPEELEMQERATEGVGHERVRSDETVKASQSGGTGEIALNDKRPWSQTDILNWTMMYVIR